MSTYPISKRVFLFLFIYSLIYQWWKFSGNCLNSGGGFFWENSDFSGKVCAKFANTVHILRPLLFHFQVFLPCLAFITAYISLNSVAVGWWPNSPIGTPLPSGVSSTSSYNSGSKIPGKISQENDKVKCFFFSGWNSLKVLPWIWLWYQSIWNRNQHNCQPARCLLLEKQ